MNYTFSSEGRHEISVTVTDGFDSASKAATIDVQPREDTGNDSEQTNPGIGDGEENVGTELDQKVFRFFQNLLNSFRGVL